MVDCLAECCVHACVYLCADLICTACIGGLCSKCKKKNEVSTDTPYSTLGMVDPYNSGPTVYNEGDKKPGVVYHTVETGESTLMIMRKYKVTVRVLLFFVFRFSDCCFDSKREGLYLVNGVKNDEALLYKGTIIIPPPSPV